MSDELPDSPEQNQPPRKLDGWELFCSGILRTQFGRRPSRAVTKAMMQLAAEEALSGPPMLPVMVSTPPASQLAMVPFKLLSTRWPV